MCSAAAQEAGPDTAQQVWRAPTGTYALDPQAVSVTMTANRFLMAPLQARFGTVAGSLTVNDTAELNRLTVHMAAGDLSANGPIVERLLTGEDFLNAAVHPTITFAAEGFNVSEAPTRVTGDLTMAGVSHPAMFDTRLDGFAHDPATGTLRLRFVAEGTLNRSDWGMTGYRGLVADKTSIRIEAEFVHASGD